MGIRWGILLAFLAAPAIGSHSVEYQNAAENRITLNLQERDFRAPVTVTLRNNSDVVSKDGSLSFTKAGPKWFLGTALAGTVGIAAILGVYDVYAGQWPFSEEMIEAWKFRLIPMAAVTIPFAPFAHYLYTQAFDDDLILNTSHSGLGWITKTHGELGKHKTVRKHLKSLLFASTVRLKKKNNRNDYVVKEFDVDVTNLGNQGLKMNAITAVLEPTERNPSAMPVTINAMKIRPKTWGECIKDMFRFGKRGGNP